MTEKISLVKATSAAINKSCNSQEKIEHDKREAHTYVGDHTYVGNHTYVGGHTYVGDHLRWWASSSVFHFSVDNSWPIPPISKKSNDRFVLITQSNSFLKLNFILFSAFLPMPPPAYLDPHVYFELPDLLRKL